MPPERPLYGDALDGFEKFKESAGLKKITAHRKFFYEKYKTYEPDALWNYRLFAIRASNYSKLYGERFASSGLIWAIFTMGVWITLVFARFINNLVCVYI